MTLNVNVRKKIYMTKNLVALVRVGGIWRRHTGEMSVEQNLERNVFDDDDKR